MDLQRDPVCLLHTTPFSQWREVDKSDIIATGRPLPNFNLWKLGVRRRTFRKVWYEEFKWLCGSDVKQAMFCWWCLIIGANNPVWCSNGFTDIANAQRGLKKHQDSADHIKSAVSFKFLLKNSNTIKESLQKLSISAKEKHNETVRLNRRVMTVLFKTALVLSRQELAFRGHNERVDSENRGNFKEILHEWLTECDKEVRNQFEKIKPTFKGDSKTVQNELIECIFEYLSSHVSKELAEAMFFSIQVDDTTDLCQIAQCSLVLRYVNCNGQLVERFFGFHDVSVDKTAEGLFTLLNNILSPLGYKERLVAQCYDGVSVMKGHLTGLQSRIKNEAPNAMFVYCMAHRLNLVLEQAAMQTTEFRIFFSDLSGFPTFFHQSSKRTATLNEILAKKLPSIANTRWTSNSKLISLISNNYESLLLVFEKIRDDPTSDKTTIGKAEGFIGVMSKFSFSFCLLTFAKIYNLTDPLWQVLQKKCLDIAYCLDQLKITRTLLSQIRNEVCSTEIYEKACHLSKSRPTGRKYADMTDKEISIEHRRLYFEAIDTVKLQFDVRFQDMEKLTFLELVDPSKYASFASTFPEAAFNNLIKHYGHFFTANTLKTQLQIFYLQFHTASVQDIVKTMRENDINEVMSEVYKLLCLVLTLPSTSVSVERSFSCLTRLKTPTRNTISEERLSSMASISIQKDLITFLREKNSNFFDSLIDIYAGKKDRRLALNYKT